MNEERWQKINVGNKYFYVFAHFSRTQKIINDKFGCSVKLDISIKDSNKQDVLWVDLSDYFKEKISDYVQNTFNGQRSFYWNWQKKPNFD